MVILIGGSSHVGKTLLAHRLVEKYKCQFLSLDYLKNAFIKTKLTNLTAGEDYKMRYFMWPFVVEIIKTALKKKQNLILEGCYIPTEWAESFTNKELNEIKCAFIIMSEDYIRKNAKSLSLYADAIEKRKDDVVDIKRLINCSNEFREECIKTMSCFIEIDTVFDINELFISMLCIIDDINPRGYSIKI